jgi:hypothetical protein
MAMPFIYRLPRVGPCLDWFLPKGSYQKVPTETFLQKKFLRKRLQRPIGSYRNVPAKKVPTKKVPGNIGPGP